MLYYEILGFENNNQTEAEIKTAYRRLARQYHPDKNKSPGAETMFKKISIAYDFLTDAQKRAEYDACINRGFIHVAADDSAWVAAPRFENPTSFFHASSPEKASRPQNENTASNPARKEPKKIETIFDCLTVSFPNVFYAPLEANLAKFISQDQHLKKNENGETPLHILAKKLHNKTIDTYLCMTLINKLISAVEVQGKLNSKALDEQDNEGNTFLDIVKKAKELPHVDASKNKDRISEFVSNLEQKVGRTNASETQNKPPKKEDVLITKKEDMLITNARKELNRITKSGCGFFMSEAKHKAKVGALEKAISSGNQTEISLALKMHRGIAPFHISNPESAKSLKP